MNGVSSHFAKGRSVLLSLLIQMLITSGTYLRTHSDILFYKLSKNPLAESSGHRKLTIPYRSTQILVCILVLSRYDFWRGFSQVLSFWPISFTLCAFLAAYAFTGENQLCPHFYFSLSQYSWRSVHPGIFSTSKIYKFIVTSKSLCITFPLFEYTCTGYSYT